MKTGLEFEIWKLFRPVEFAVKVFDMHGFDIAKLEQFEEDWKEFTLPKVKTINWKAACQKEIQGCIEFFEGKKKKLLEEFELSRPSKKYEERKKIVDASIPALNGLIETYQKWLKRVPKLQWEPGYVEDLKKFGTEKFVKIYLRNFYE